MKRSAVFSPCGKFRHLLIRRWVDDLPLLVMGLLNPSVANDEKDDPTARKGIGFARELGYGGMVFFNIFDYCATYPKDLKKAGYPNSPDADRYILEACAMGDGTVICGWGANARGLARPLEVIKLIMGAGYKPMALRLLADGVPEHPLMLPYVLRPEPLTCALYGLQPKQEIRQPAPELRGMVQGVLTALDDAPYSRAVSSFKGAAHE